MAKPMSVMFSDLPGHLCPEQRLLRLPVGASIWLPSAKVLLFTRFLERTNKRKEMLPVLTAVITTLSGLPQSIWHQFENAV